LEDFKAIDAQTKQGGGANHDELERRRAIFKEVRKDIKHEEEKKKESNY
jgi:hypothetical protein